MSTHELRAEGLALGYGDVDIVHDLTLPVPDARVTVIIGGNASGKSTLLRGLARLLRPRAGAVLLDGHRLQDLDSVEVAKVVGLLPQSPVAPEGITVADLVGRGRYPYQGWFRRWTGSDEQAVWDAMSATGVDDLARRPLAELSGGQKQRVWVAMALAQQTDILLLDEPTTYLDINHQVELLDLLSELNRTRGTTIVLVLHDLNFAVRYADHLVAVKDGRIVVEGTPEDVVTAEMVTEVFGLECRVVPCPVSGAPMVVPLVRRQAPAGAGGRPLRG